MGRLSISRRRLIALVAAFGAGRATGSVAAIGLPRLTGHNVFVLDPVAQGAGAGCASCNACRRHAEHKRFATAEAANHHRAHPHCRCGIRAIPLSPVEFDRLFPLNDLGVRLDHADLRWPGAPLQHSMGGGLEKPVAGDR